MTADGSSPARGDALGPLRDALDAQQDRLSACVHCGFCLPACPTYVRLGDEADSPRGRLHLMRAVAEGRLEASSDAFHRHVDRCLGCRACETVCPSGVEYGYLLERARAASFRERKRPWTVRALLALFGSGPGRAVALALGRALRATRLPAFLARRLPGRGPLRSVRYGLAMLAASRPWVPRGTPDPEVGAGAPETEPPDRGPVTLLRGCVQAGLFSHVNRATERVLAAQGYRVASVAGQGCCGALHAHAGDLEGARRLARANVDAFGRLPGARVVVNAAGCGAVMKEYGELLAGDRDYAERAAMLAASVCDVAQALAEAGPRVGAPLTVSVAYDEPCHLQHAQRVSAEAHAVLDAIPGLTRRPLDGADECCGGAGIYALTHADLGGWIGSDKVAAVVRCGASVVATGNPGCIMQIGAGLCVEGSDVQVTHPVVLLDESYRRAGFYRTRPAGVS